MKRTIGISASVHVDVVVDLLWSYVEDYGNDRFWRTGLLALVAPLVRALMLRGLRRDLRTLSDVLSANP